MSGTNGASGIGKISSKVFSETIFPHLGAPSAAVLVGPRAGLDAGIVDIGAGQVMAVTSDPFFVVPEYGWERAAWFAVHIVVSDAATSGLRPAYLTIDLNLPPEIDDADLSALWTAIHAACYELDIAVIAGHTGRYDSCAFPITGGATAISVGARDAYVTPAMARPGDIVMLTKGPAIETAALFAVTFPERISALLGEDVARAGENLFGQMSVVRDALAAASAGVRDRGVTAMHDATERGVLGGLAEIADASGTGLLVDLDAAAVRPEVAAICRLFAVDPFTTSSEGTLLLTCRPHAAEEVAGRLTAQGIDAYCIGEVVPAERGLWVVRDGRELPLEPPVTDPFWPAYRRALEERR